jgi:hypothetical protein
MASTLSAGNYLVAAAARDSTIDPTADLGSLLSDGSSIGDYGFQFARNELSNAANPPITAPAPLILVTLSLMVLRVAARHRSNTAPTSWHTCSSSLGCSVPTCHDAS